MQNIIFQVFNKKLLLLKQLIILSILTFAISDNLSSLKIVCDDYLTGLRINNKDIDLSSYPVKQGTINSYIINLDFQLKGGDLISIDTQNYSSYVMGNPGNMLAQINYYTSFGELKILYTNSDQWTCNGLQASSYGLSSSYAEISGIKQGTCIYSPRLYDTKATCETILPYDSMELMNKDIDINNSICTSGRDSYTKIKTKRSNIHYICELRNSSGYLIPQEQIETILMNDQLFISFMDKTRKSLIDNGYTIEYFFDGIFVNIEITLDNNQLISQSVSYDIQKGKIGLLMTIL